MIDKGKSLSIDMHPETNDRLISLIKISLISTYPSHVTSIKTANKKPKEKQTFVIRGAFKKFLD